MKTISYLRTVISITGKIAQAPVTATLGAILLAAVFVLFPSAATAQCKQWDVSGSWVANVDKGASENFELQQSGNSISGKSHFYSTPSAVTGTVDGDHFSIAISWTGQQLGATHIEVFDGMIGSDGFIHGHASTLARPDVNLKNNPWSSDRSMKCLVKTIHHTGAPKTPVNTTQPDETLPNGKVIHHTGHARTPSDPEPAPEPTTPTPPVNTTQPDETLPNGKVIHHTGHAKTPSDPEPAPETTPVTEPVGTSGKVIQKTGRPKVTPDSEPAPGTTTGATSETAPETPSVPVIIASPNNIKLVAGKGTGQTTLTWDGGLTHRAAELWVKVDDAEETKVVQSGKGTLQAAVIPGKIYIYTLKDKSGVLATVTVQFQR